MKVIHTFAIAFFFLASQARAEVTGQYGIHLFFNEKEFIDVMTIKRAPNGGFTGEMNVPNDFEGPLLNLVADFQEMSFDLLVPKNAARPVDLIFEYRGRFFDDSQDQLTGFVTIKGQKDFVASFVAFKRNPQERMEGR